MSYKNFTQKQWCLLLIYSVINILNASCSSIQGPFYPLVARIKGASSSQYGVVFGVFYLTIFFISPFCKKLISLVGAKFVCSTGIFITGVTNILFGLLDMVNGTELFIGLSIVIRIFEAIGTSAFRVASLCIISNEFSDNIESAFAIFQSFFNAGFIVGPYFGGLLYETGGFILPFTVEGVFQLCAVIAIKVLPRDWYKKDCVTLKYEVKYVDLLKRPLVVMGLMISFGTYMSTGLIIVFLEAQVKPLSWSPSDIGLCLALHCLCVILSCPFWAKLCETYLAPHYVWSIGSVLNLFSLLLFGPAPYFSTEMNIYICIICIIINGIAEGCQTIASFSGINKEVESTGVPMDKETHGIISTLYTSSLALGTFVGATMGGFLYDSIGLPWGCHVYALYQLILVLGTIIVVCVKKKMEFAIAERERIPINSLGLERKSVCKNNYESISKRILTLSDDIQSEEGRLSKEFEGEH